MGKNKKKNMLGMISDLHYKPYKLGGSFDGKEWVAFDCMTMINRYLYISGGIKIPMRILGVDYSDYSSNYNESPDMLTSVFLGILRSKLEVIDRNLFVSGDILWIENDSGRFPVIFAGNNSVLGCFKETGTSFTDMSEIYNSIRWVFRWDHL